MNKIIKGDSSFRLIKNINKVKVGDSSFRFAPFGMTSIIGKGENVMGRRSRPITFSHIKRRACHSERSEESLQSERLSFQSKRGIPSIKVPVILSEAKNPLKKIIIKRNHKKNI